MSQPSQPAGAPEPEPRPRAAYANPGMRISDAERAEVSDRLSTHYSEGRLDEAEFSKRLDQAMHAVTQSDLDGLFNDLPDDAAGLGGAADGGRSGAGRAGSRRGGQRVTSPDRAAPAYRPRRPLARILMLAVLIVVAAVIGSALSHLFFPWILIAVVVAFWLRRGSGRRHRDVPPEA
jgi:Domain of unknown function (DUF1707)